MREIKTTTTICHPGSGGILDHGKQWMLLLEETHIFFIGGHHIPPCQATQSRVAPVIDGGVVFFQSPLFFTATTGRVEKILIPVVSATTGIKTCKNISYNV